MSENNASHIQLPDLTGIPCQQIDYAARADGLEACADSSPRDIAHMAMGVMFQERRAATEDCPDAGICEECIAPHVERLTDTAEDGQPLQLMLLGFPCKSSNLDKVLSAAPDLAEIISLRHLDGWTQAIGSFYEPGAEVVIGADGRAFADLVEVPDETISDYVRGIRHIIEELGLSIQYVGLDDFLPDLAEKGDYEGIRATLTEDCTSAEALRERAHQDPDFCHRVNGMQRFLENDLRYAFPDMSKRKLRKTARQRAYEIISRGDVLRNELELRYPHAARLSIHPQSNHCTKFGVHITPSHKDRVTPWHAAALRHADGSLQLVKRCEAEEQGAEVVNFDNGQPSHLELAAAA